eukprot:scaffold4410_cov44-Attheya_sp.AAC.2
MFFFDAALVEYRKCLAIREVVLGKNHPDTAKSYNIIGLALYTKGGSGLGQESPRHTSTSPQGSCHSGKVVLDKNHPSMATSYNNIGLALGSKFFFDAALVEYRKCLAIWEVTLGRDHPNTIATTSENIRRVEMNM